MNYHILLGGFPGRCQRGFLGWSTVILLETADGPVLFDTGGAGDRLGLMQALTQRGVAPSDIKTVILSHLHFDHVANAECFPQAEFVVHEDEVAYVRRYGAKDLGVPRLLVESLLANLRIRLVTGEPEVLPGVFMLKTPGHTDGHVSLMFKARDKTVILAQDAIKSRTDLNCDIVPGATNQDAAKASIDRIIAMADVVVPGHDAEMMFVNGRLDNIQPCSQTIIITATGKSLVLEV